MSSGRRYRPPNPVQSTRRNVIQEQQQESTPYFGIYQGEVRRTDDYTRSGYIQVFIDKLAKDPSTNGGLFECRWTSPFAGSTPAAGLGTNIEKYEETLKTYGFWMVPPDIGNLVLVAFGDGNPTYPYIVGCIFPDQFNYMVPGMASGKSYSDPDIAVPVAEKNKKDERTTQNDAVRPIAPYLAKSIVEQGLINDPIRGAGTASARREAPSAVFGILTPGPLEENSSGTNTEVRTNRTGGHQFIMDDNPGSRMIRFRTAGGTQIMLDDTTESIYMINKNGKGWLEINKLGEINVYAEGGINLRTKGNFNVRADQNINLEAGQNIKIRAAGDNAGGQYLGPNPGRSAGLGSLGNGGTIKFEAAADIQQFAASNYTVTAAGGDFDLNTAGDIRVNSNGPWGISARATAGPIALGADASGVNITASLGIGLVAATGISLQSTPILLNSGPASGGLWFAWPAKTTGPFELNEHQDQPVADPEFDLDAALEGRSAVKNAGRRSGPQDTIKTIVGKLITAEPYAGHGQGAKPGFDEPIVAASDVATRFLPPAASTQDGRPDDVQTPEGARAGDTYVDSNGNTVSSSPGSPSEASRAGRARATVENAANDAERVAGRAASAINNGSARINAELSNLRNAIPTYADIQNAINDFGNAVEKKIDEVLGISAFIASIKAQIPPIRFPTTNVLRQQILAGVKELRELEYQLKQFSLDKLGLPIDLNIPAIRDLQNQINGVMAQARDGLDAVNRLRELGINVVNDAGSLIYTDSLGNTLVDFRNGVGPIASSLAVQSEIARTYTNIRSAITVPISNNQAQALASFAKDIGEENFRNSNVLQALNEGLYNEVPRLMAQWSLGPPVGATTPTPRSNLVYRQDLNDTRYFQGQVFQSPDNLDIGPPPDTVDGGLTAREMGDIIKARRAEFNAANYAGPIEYYAGPRR